MKYADRVLETTSTQGTGTINLLGPTTGFRAFAASIASGSKVPYVIDDGTDWEVGIGTITSGDPDTLSRDTVMASTNSDAAVDWGAGTRNVRLAPTALLTMQRDENLNDVNGFGEEGGTANAHIVTLYPEPIAYSDGMVVKWFAPAANTGNVTVNVNGLGAKSYINNDGSEFPAGLVKNGSPQIAIYSAGSNSFVSLVPIVAGTAATKDAVTDFSDPSDDDVPTSLAVETFVNDAVANVFPDAGMTPVAMGYLDTSSTSLATNYIHGATASRTATGAITVTLNAAMASANYTVIMGYNNGGGTTPTAGLFAAAIVSTTQFKMAGWNSGGAARDGVFWFAVYGVVA